MAKIARLDQVHAVIHGIVQGVGFRYFVKHEADRLQVSGWVENCYNGTVETVLQGYRKNLELLLNKLHSGPKMARVKRIDFEWQDVDEVYSGFEIR